MSATPQPPDGRPRSERRWLDRLVESRSLEQLIAALPDSPRERRRELVDEAIKLVSGFYVHGPAKREATGVDVVTSLQALRDRLDGGLLPDDGEWAFHAEMCARFAALRDRHTAYQLPPRFRSTVVYLPFVIEECWAGDGISRRPRYVVTKAHAAAAPGFGPGVEVIHWNGVPVARAVALEADRSAGANDSARRALGVMRLTVRWLGAESLPDEEWVSISYVSAAGGARETHDFEWQAAELEACTEDDAQGVDVGRELIRRHRAAEYATPASTRFPDLLDLRRETPAGTPCAYLRIFSFTVAGAVDDFVAEVARLLRDVSDRPVIIDVRGNTGGSLTAAERLLQLLAPSPIQPQPLQFLCTPLTHTLAKAAFPEWADSIERGVSTGRQYSDGLPLEPPEHYNAIGQQHQGPFLLVIDALSYSAADTFAAGFQDHGLGPVMGTNERTGGGGANVFEHERLREQFGDAPGGPADLADGPSFRLALRRTLRVGPNAGRPVEGAGVERDIPYYLSEVDLLERNRDLIEAAAEELGGRPRYRLAAEPVGERGFRLTAENLARVEISVDDGPPRSVPLPCRDVVPTGPWSQARFRGFDADGRVAATYRREAGA